MLPAHKTSIDYHGTEHPDVEKDPIFVDLDGSLLKTDTICELIFLLFKEHFFLFLLIPFWLIKGKSYFKSKISQKVSLDPKTLPYNEELLSYLEIKRTQGHLIYLATGSFADEAKAIAAHLQLFSDVLASTKDLNLIGKNKLKAIQEKTRKGSFIYVGNSFSDLPIWKEASKGILVRPQLGLKHRALKLTHFDFVFSRQHSLTHSLFKGFRIHQWVKNLLLFVPMLAAHDFFSWDKWQTLFFGFFAFCLIASSVYMINDLLDLHHDRRHPTKRKRPFASGDLPLWIGFIFVPAFLFSGLTIAYLISFKFFTVASLYFTLTCAYSFKLKSILLIDVMTLAGLYSLRVLAGGVLLDLFISPWLLSFCCFMFLSLALAKRSTELLLFKKSRSDYSIGRNYQLEDISIVQTLGLATACIGILVLALYISSPQVSVLYKNPDLLWFICLGLFYWVGRIWILTARGLMNQDPVVFAIKDKTSYIVLALLLCIFLAASFYPF